jgi:hypothetical protein
MNKESEDVYETIASKIIKLMAYDFENFPYITDQQGI